MTSKEMWKWFRRNEKMIMAAIAVLVIPAFGFGGILVSSVASSGQRTDAAIIDGEKLPIIEFDALRKRFLNLGNSFAGYLKAQRYLRDEIKIDNYDIYKHVRVLREADEAGLMVSDSEVTEIIEDYGKTSARLPYLQKATNYLVLKELVLYSQSLQFHLGRASQGDKYTPEKLANYLGRMGLGVADFRKTVKEMLLFMKFKYFLWSTVMVDEARAFENYRRENASISCAFVRVDSAAFVDEAAAVPESDQRSHYDANTTRFETPWRKRIEYVFGDTAQIEKRVILSDSQKRSFYEREKNSLFRLPDEQGAGGGAQPGSGTPGGSDPSGNEPGEKKEEQPKPEPKFKPFESPEVQEVIRQKIASTTAAEFMEGLMSRVSHHVERAAATVREGAADIPDVTAELRDRIDFAQIASKISNDPELAGGYLGLKLATLRAETALSREDIEKSFGSFGPMIAEKAWGIMLYSPSQPIAVPGGYLVFRVIEDRFPALPPFEDVRDRVIKDYRVSKAIDKALERAKSLRQKMDSSGFESVAQAEDLKVLKSGFFRKTDTTVLGTEGSDALGAAPAVVAAAFGVEPGGIGQPVIERGLESVVVFKVLQKKDPSAAEMPDGERESFLRSEKTKIWEEVNRPWGEEFRKHHKIEDLTRVRTEQ